MQKLFLQIPQVITFIAFSSFTLVLSAATTWSGPEITVTKAAFADPTSEFNQDRITDNVWLTRGSVQGFYNIKTEASFTNNSSPADTEWALGSTDELGSLTFDDFQGFVLGTVGSNNILQLIDQGIVLHLISEDIYIDFMLKDWGVANGGGGSFTYERSTPIPEPTLLAMLTVPLLAIAVRRRRSQDR